MFAWCLFHIFLKFFARYANVCILQLLQPYYSLSDEYSESAGVTWPIIN